MNDGGLAGIPNQVGALAALLNAIAEGTDDARGRRRWDSLARLINSQVAADPGQSVSGVAELAALRQRPGDPDRAEALATAMLIRAGKDTAFGKRLTAWRSQKQNQELESIVGVGRRQTVGASAPVPADAPRGTIAKPAESGSELGTRLQVVLAAVSVVISLVGWRSRPSQAIALAVIIVAVVVAWYRLRQGRTWRDRPVLVPGVACLVAAIVLVVTYLVAKPAGVVGKPAGASPVPSAGSTVAATAANAPARVEGVTPMINAPKYNEATARTTPISATQLASLNAAVRSGSPKAAQILASLNAAQIDKGLTDVTVVGNQKLPVTIIGLQVVKHCQAPLRGTLFFSPGSGIETTLPIDFNLDGTGSGNSYPLPGKVVKLAQGEPFTFTLTAETSKYYCQFSFLMMVATADGNVAERINDAGKPFALTVGLQPSKYSAVYAGGVVSPDSNGDYVSVNPKYVG